MKYFINLTAGLMQDKYVGHIIRIQSSHLESHAFDRLFFSLSDELLFWLAKGEDCLLVDCSSNSVGKVIKRGVPIITAVLHKRWFEVSDNDLSVEYFERIIASLSHHTKRKLDYYKKFNPSFPIKLGGVSIFVNKEIYKNEKNRNVEKTQSLA